MNYISPIQAGVGCKHEMFPLSRCSREQAHDHPSIPARKPAVGQSRCTAPRAPPAARSVGIPPRSQGWVRTPGSTGETPRPLPEVPRPESAGAACGKGGLGPFGAQSRHRRAGRAGELSSPPVALRQQPLSPRPELLMSEDGGFFNSETQQSRTFPRQDPPDGKFDI